MSRKTGTLAIVIEDTAIKQWGEWVTFRQNQLCIAEDSGAGWMLCQFLDMPGWWSLRYEFLRVLDIEIEVE